MFFSWLNVELGEIHRQECMAQARTERLIREIRRADKRTPPLAQRTLARLGQWLEIIGRNLQGLQGREPTDLMSWESRSASYD